VVELIPYCSRIDSLFRRAGNFTRLISQTIELKDVLEADFSGKQPIPRKFAVVSLLTASAGSSARLLPEEIEPERAG
jgi:hypothetical protein